MLLIYPPIARTTEPPLGIARLAGLLRRHGAPAQCLDLSRDGIDYLLGLEINADDTATRGALRRRVRQQTLLRSPAGYENQDRYRRAVFDLQRALKAASARAGVEVGLADYRDPNRSPVSRRDLRDAAAAYETNVFFPVFRDRIHAALSASGAQRVGISVNYLSQALCAFAIAGFLRASRPDLDIVLGGSLITSWIAQGRIVDTERFGGLVGAILPGRGEEAIGALLKTTGIRTSLHAAPDFSDFGDGYFAPRAIIPYNFAGGCAWRRCSFCPESTEARRYVPTPLEYAFRDLATLVDRHQPGLLHFTDNEITPRYLQALAAHPPGAPWYGFARFCAALTDEAMCRKLAASGCVMLQLGLESGDQHVLDRLGKGTRLDAIERALDALAAAGIAVFLYLLFGTPAEDRDSACRTRDFVAAHAEQIGFLNVAVFNLPIASIEARRLQTTTFYPGDLSLYCEFRHPRGWNRDAVRSFLATEFDTEPAIQPILARTPPVFTSNHAPFFVHRQTRTCDMP